MPRIIYRHPASVGASAAVFAGFVVGRSVLSPTRLRISVVGGGLTALAKATVS
jgi:hypothetical protein